MTDTPNAPTPTTPATAEQLREDAAMFREAAVYSAPFGAALQLRAAAALDAEAARREREHVRSVCGQDARLCDRWPCYCSVRLTTEGAE